MSDPNGSALFHISDELAKKAQHDRQHTIKLGTVVGLAPAAGLGALPGTITPAKTKLVEFLSGVSVKPAPGGFTARLKPGAILYLAPAPIGVVPAEYYGLRPDYLRNVVPVGLQFEAIGTKASPARVEEFNRKEVIRLLNEPAHKNFTYQYTSIPEFERNAALLEPFRGQDSRVDERLKLVDRQRHVNAMFSDRGTGTVGVRAAVVEVFDTATVPPIAFAPFPAPLVLSAVVPMGSTQPELVEPVNEKAIAIQASATGIRKQLVTERADP